MKGFWETVRVLRARAGYSTARAFHRAWRRSGAGACSYKAYCEIEAGRLIPSPDLAARLAAGLDLRPGSRKADAFRGAYLFSTTHSRYLAQTLLNALRPENGSWSLAERALSVGQARSRHVLTAAQKQLVVENPAARMVSLALHSRSGPWTPDALASALGLSPAAARAALSRLASVGLARGRKDAFTWRLADRDIVFPRPTPDELEKMGGSFSSGFPAAAWSRQCVVLIRARHDGARRLAGRAVRMASSALALHRRAGKGGIFSVGAIVRRVS